MKIILGLAVASMMSYLVLGQMCPDQCDLQASLADLQTRIDAMTENIGGEGKCALVRFDKV